MRHMKGKTENVRMGLEILTPVQTGSGINLSKDLDYIGQNGKPFVVDQSRTFEAIAAGNTALDSVLSGCRLGDLVSLAGQRIGYELTPLSGQSTVPEQIREQLKDAFLRPYIPGTALKGAIRTVLFASVLRELPVSAYAHLLPKWNPERRQASAAAKMAAQKLAQNLFGKDPNNRGKDSYHDLLRALHVGDALFAQDDLRLADIRFFNLKQMPATDQACWRNMKWTPQTETPKNVGAWQDAFGVYSEMLAPQSLAPVTLQWDGFLLSNLKWHSDNPIPNLLPRDFKELRARINGHAIHRLDGEIAFYKEYGQLKPLEECQRIQRIIDAEPDAAYLQLSWGSGWCGMTGDWLTNESKETMRGLYREMRGRDGMPFPKTRRLAVSNGSPCLPLGWIRLCPWEMVADCLAEREIQQKANSTRCAWLDETIAKIVALNRCKEDEALRGKALAEAWQALTDMRLKQEAFVDIKERWQANNWWDQPPGKSARSAKSIYDQT